MNSVTTSCPYLLNKCFTSCVWLELNDNLLYLPARNKMLTCPLYASSAELLRQTNTCSNTSLISALVNPTQPEHFHSLHCLCCNATTQDAAMQILLGGKLQSHTSQHHAENKPQSHMITDKTAHACVLDACCGQQPHNESNTQNWQFAMPAMDTHKAMGHA